MRRRRNDSLRNNNKFSIKDKMKLIINNKANNRGILSHRHKLWLRVICLPVVLLCAMVTSCKDDVLNSDEPAYPGGDGKMIAVDLPGVFGINLSLNEEKSTRVDDVYFDDGSDNEYDLSEPIGDEFYHYLLIYGNTDDSKPLIFPIDVTQTHKEGGSYDNITLTVSKILTNKENGEVNGNEALNGLNSVADLSSFLRGKKAYILLNFKLDDSNFYNDVNVAGATTAAKLSNITKAGLENLQMKDFKVTGQKTTTGTSGNTQPGSAVNNTFFTMTNSVYSNNSAKVIDGEFDSSKIFTNETSAKNNPALTVHVERLASKVTVSFNAGKMKSVKFGPSAQDSYDISEVTVGADGLPEINTTVRKVRMGDNSGFEINHDGYEILTDEKGAKIKILGFGLSNLESSQRLFKDINYTYGTDWNWNDEGHRRCYWARDEHYSLTRSESAPFTKMQGYPHQFRKALETDSVTSYHSGGYIYSNPDGEKDSYEINGVPYESYNQIGEIDKSENLGDQCYLLYKSYDELDREFKGWHPGHATVTSDGGVTTTFDPVYTMENTYIDQGMFTSNVWRWPWVRAPYATATNLIVMARISVESDNGNIGENPTLYLDQNNIFYESKVDFLKSKLGILNRVMLSGGNAGIQILNGQWDSHAPHASGKDTPNQTSTLDKVAWNENSVLWFAEVDLDEAGNPKMKQVEGKDENGNTVTMYKPELKTQWEVSIDNDATEQDLDLIPAEISGGDGQRLIAPSEKFMGKKYRYYLAPPVLDNEGKRVMDESLAVEISYNHLVALIHKIIGPVDVYRDGLMYYSVPIPHRIPKYGNGENSDAWKHFASFSVVRNNWYNISVTQFTKLGTPVDDVYQPIIPVMDVKRSYINMGVEVKDYHDVTQDNVPMM